MPTLTLDVPFPADGAVMKLVDAIGTQHPDVVRLNQPGVTLLAASLLGTAAKVAMVNARRIPGNIAGLVMGPSGSGKSSVVDFVCGLVEEICVQNPDFPFRVIGASEGTGEAVEQMIQKFFDEREGFGFAHVVIKTDELGEVLRAVGPRGAQSYLQSLLRAAKHISTLAPIEAPRATPGLSRYIPRGGYYASMYMLMTPEDYMDHCSDIDRAMIRRLSPIYFGNPVPLNVFCLRTFDYQKCEEAKRLIAEFTRMHVIVVLDPALQGEAEQLNNEILRGLRKMGADHVVLQSAVETFTLLIAYRALDRAWRCGKLDDVSDPHPFFSTYLDKNRVKFPIEYKRVYVEREDLRAAAFFMEEYVVPAYKELIIFGDREVLRVKRVIDALLEENDVIKVQQAARKAHMRYSKFADIIQHLVLAGVVAVLEEDFTPVPIEEIPARLHGGMLLTRPERVPARGIKELKRALNEKLAKKHYIEVSKLSDDELRAALSLLEEGSIWLFEFRGKWYITKDTVLIEELGSKEEIEAHTGPKAIELIKERFGNL